MSERVEHFEIDGPVRLSVRIPTGDTRLVAGEPGRVVVRLSGSERELARFVVERRADSIVVEPERSGVLGRWTSVRLVVESGAPVDLVIRSATGNLTAAVPLTALRVVAASGDVDASEVLGAAFVKSASGNVRLGSVRGGLEVVAASGDVVVGSVGGELRAKTASGDVRAGDVSGNTSVTSASGDVGIAVFRGGDLDVKTLSGDVEVGLTAGRRFEVSLQTVSGDVRTDFPVSGDKSGSATGRLSLSSVSGDLIVRSAR